MFRFWTEFIHKPLFVEKLACLIVLCSHLYENGPEDTATGNYSYQLFKSKNEKGLTFASFAARWGHLGLFPKQSEIKLDLFLRSRFRARLETAKPESAFYRPAPERVVCSGRCATGRKRGQMRGPARLGARAHAAHGTNPRARNGGRNFWQRRFWWRRGEARRGASRWAVKSRDLPPCHTKACRDHYCAGTEMNYFPTTKLIVRWCTITNDQR